MTLLKRIGVALAGVILLGVALVVVNGVLLSSGETPVAGETNAPPREVDESRPVKILAYNIAKCFVYEGGTTFASTDQVRARVDAIARLIRQEDPDLVFLSEGVTECGPCPVNQVVEIAAAAGMRHWVFGENYNIGLPGFRMVGGNAILSHRPLTPIANPSLAGRKPFFVTKNNRRVLWCSASLGGSTVCLASIHNDSFDIATNERQIEQILAFGKDMDVILAGDFNSMPGQPPIQNVKASGRFTGNFDGPPTFDASDPTRRIDFIFAPGSWKLLDERVLCDPVSDHCAVAATFAPSPNRDEP